VGLGLAACSDEPDPWLREPVALFQADALGTLLDRAARLDGTPLGQWAGRLRVQLDGCKTVWGHLPPPPAASDPRELLATLECLEPETTHEASSADARHEADAALRAVATERRGPHAGWIQWPLGEEGRLELSIDVTSDEGILVTGWLEPPGEPGALALLLPGREPAAPPAMATSQALLYARMRPADGFHLSSLIPAGGQADRLFALKSRLLEGALLSGTWEIAFMPPAPGGRLPLVVAAVHHRHEAPIRQAIDETLDQLERTWPIHRTPRRFVSGSGEEIEGGCFLDLPLLPELAPCWVLTPSALLVGYRSEALDAALAAPATDVVGRSPSPSAGDPELLRSGLEVHFDRMRSVDRRLAPDSRDVRPSDLWSRFELRLDGTETGRVALHAQLEARP
jgi:hypothetical protein